MRAPEFSRVLSKSLKIEHLAFNSNDIRDDLVVVDTSPLSSVSIVVDWIMPMRSARANIPKVGKFHSISTGITG